MRRFLHHVGVGMVRAGTNVRGLSTESLYIGKYNKHYRQALLPMSALMLGGYVVFQHFEKKHDAWEHEECRRLIEGHIMDLEGTLEWLKKQEVLNQSKELKNLLEIPSLAFLRALMHGSKTRDVGCSLGYTLPITFCSTFYMWDKLAIDLSSRRSHVKANIHWYFMALADELKHTNSDVSQALRKINFIPGIDVEPKLDLLDAMKQPLDCNSNYVLDDYEKFLAQFQPYWNREGKYVSKPSFSNVQEYCEHKRKSENYLHNENLKIHFYRNWHYLHNQPRGSPSRWLSRIPMYAYLKSSPNACRLPPTQISFDSPIEREEHYCSFLYN